MYDALLILVVFVLIKAFFTVRQTKLLKNTFNMLGLSGEVYFGQDKSFPLAGIIILVAVNEYGKVLDAKQFKLLKLLIPAKVMEYPRIIGKNLNKLTPSDISDDKRDLNALENLLKNYNKIPGNK